MCKVLLNEKLNGVELYFEGKPAASVLTDLKVNGFRWNSKKVCWYAKQSEKTLNAANKYGNVDTYTEDKTPVKKVNKIDLFELTTFEKVERELIYDTKEIAKQIRSHVKKRFPFVKFSITTKGYNSINCDILSSPFEKDSKYLEAVREYCKAYADSYNYNNSDIMTDYFDVNFYGGYFQTSWNYEQVEATQEIIEAMKDFDNKLIKAMEEKKAQEEREYQEYLLRREQEQKEYEERKKQEEQEKEYICNNVKVVEVEEDKQYFVRNAAFANLNKNNTLEQYQEEVEKGKYYLNTLKVTREIHFTDEKALKYFENMLLHDFDFIFGTGGSYTDDLRINSMSDYYNMTKEEQKTVEWLLQGIAVYYNNEVVFVIDAQGFSYARYVGLIGENTEVTKEYNCKQVLDIEEVEELKQEAREIIEVFEEVTQNNSLENWYTTRKEIVKAIKENCLLSLDKQVVQQIKDEKIKDYMYRVLKENDTIKDQFIENNLIQGQQLTIVRESAIGGASVSHITFSSHEIIENSYEKDSVKMIMSVKGKKGLYSTNINNRDNVLIYNGHIDIPTHILYEDTNGGIMTKYGSYEKGALRDISDYLKERNILPVINTFEPVF